MGSELKIVEAPIHSISLINGTLKVEDTIVYEALAPQGRGASANRFDKSSAHGSR